MGNIYISIYISHPGGFGGGDGDGDGDGITQGASTPLPHTLWFLAMCDAQQLSPPGPA